MEITGSFEAMGLKEDLLRGIYAYGFQNPSAIQQRAIIPMIAGRDVIAQSQSGTGKSTIFCIGILQVWTCVGGGVVGPTCFRRTTGRALTIDGFCVYGCGWIDTVHRYS